MGGGLVVLGGRRAGSAGTLDPRAQRVGRRDLASGCRSRGEGVRAERDRVRREGARAGAGGPRDLSVPSPRRLVLDTNVWLDWLVFDDPSIAPIKAAVAANSVEILIDAACEAELERALGYDLGRKFTLDADAQGAFIAEGRRVARRLGSRAGEADGAHR